MDKKTLKLWRFGNEYFSSDGSLFLSLFNVCTFLIFLATHFLKNFFFNSARVGRRDRRSASTSQPRTWGRPVRTGYTQSTYIFTHEIFFTLVRSLLRQSRRVVIFRATPCN